MTTYKGDPPHIARAKALLSEALQRRATDAYTKPSGCVSILDIHSAESALASAQNELEEYQRSDSHMFETVNAEGKKGLAISPLRGDMLQQKQDKVAKRRRELAAITRAWIAGTEE